MIDGIQKINFMSFGRDLDVDSSASASQGVTPGNQTGQGFLDALQDAATDMTENLKHAEKMSFDGINGKANTREVVDAMLQAEQSLQTAMAVRDKIVSAYLEITKMQI
ncbi:flagellar hook-basal body complex protein FliE [Rhizobium sp. PAMB 3182]